MKTMKTSIVLKMLIGVTTAVLTVTGIAVPMAIGSVQNKANVFETADEDIWAAETIVDMEIIGDEINIVEGADAAEEIMTKFKYVVNDGQSTDVVVVDDVQKSDDELGMVVATAESTVTGTIEGIGKQTNEGGQPIVPAEPEVTEGKQEDEDCIVGHRYCVCGATFNFYKNSGLDKDAWMAHAREHAAKGEAVRWTDK